LIVNKRLDHDFYGLLDADREDTPLRRFPLLVASLGKLEARLLYQYSSHSSSFKFIEEICCNSASRPRNRFRKRIRARKPVAYLPKKNVAQCPEKGHLPFAQIADADYDQSDSL
jgi:hypothetical protein